MKYPRDGECHAFLCARCFVRLATPRRAAAPSGGYEPLAHNPTNCHADVSRRRARTLGPAAQTMVIVLGTRFGAQSYEIPL